MERLFMLIEHKGINFTYVSTEEELLECIELVESLPLTTLLGIDVEGYPNYKYGERASALDPHTSIVRLISLYSLEMSEPIVVDCLKVGAKPLIEALQPFSKVAHNAVFDIKIIRSNFGVWLSNCYCSMVAMCTLSVSNGWKVGSIRGHALDDLARDYFDIRLVKELSRSDWSKTNLTEDQLAYSAMDVASPKNTKGVRSILIEGFELLRHTCYEVLDEQYSFDLDQDSIPMMARMEYNGMPISIPTLRVIVSTIKPLLEESQIKLCKHLGLSVQHKLVKGESGLELQLVLSESNTKLLNNNKALVKYVAEVIGKSGLVVSDLKAETLEVTLKSLEADEVDEDEYIPSAESKEYSIDLIKDLLKYKRYVKMLSETEKYISLSNPITGGIHSGIRVIGASTGRMSSRGIGKESLNIQQVNSISFDLLIDEADLVCCSMRMEHV